MPVAAPFWETTPLAAMSREQWESLCDRCGRCCLHKLREDDGTILFTNVGCRLLDAETANCSDYARRARRVPDCVRLTPASLAEIDWLPPTCAYRLLGEGKGLPDWHPLVSGDPDSVRAAGVSVHGRVVNERKAGPLEHHIVSWPGRAPGVAGGRTRRPATRIRRKAAG